MGLSSVASFLSVGGAIASAGLALKSIVDTTQKYAREVRDLSQVSGEGAESTSRFIQVLDDYELTAQDALAATRFLTKKGLAPNIETLAKLSDQYLAINDVEERNAFILANLGRGGLQWVNVLKQGSAVLIAQGAAVSKNLILDEKAIRASEEYRLAVDELNDAKQGLAVTIGTKLLPVMTTFLEDLASGPTMTRNLRIAITDLKREGLDPVTRGYIEMARQAEKAAGIAVDGLEAQGDAMADLTDANQTYLSQLDDLTQSDQNYADRRADLGQQIIDAQAEVDLALKQGYSKTGGHVRNLMGTLGDLQDKYDELATAQGLDIRRMELALIEKKFLIDGTLSPAETEYLRDLGVKWGVYSQSGIDSMKAIEAEAANMVGIFNGLPDYKTFTMNLVTNFSGGGGTTTGTGTTGTGGNGNPIIVPDGSHATGGSWMIPPGYGYEGYRFPDGNTASGGETVTVTPKGGSTSAMGAGDPIDYKKLARTIRDAMMVVG